MTSCVSCTVAEAGLRFFSGFHDGFQYHHHLLHCLILSAHQRLSSGRHRNLDPGVCAGLPWEPVCGLVCVLQSEEEISDLFIGAESGHGGCFCAAQRSSFLAVPGRRPGLGVWLSGMQAGALPVKCEHVRVHLPHLPYEHGPLDGCHKAFCVSENENQAFPVVPPAGSLGDFVHPGTADALLPQQF